MFQCFITTHYDTPALSHLYFVNRCVTCWLTCDCPWETGLGIGGVTGGWTLRCLFRSCHSVSQLYKLVSKAIKKNHLPYVLSFVEMKTALGTALYSAREFSPFTYKLQRLSTPLTFSHVHICVRTHTCAHVYRWSMYTGGLHKYWMTTHLRSTLSRWL